MHHSRHKTNFVLVESPYDAIVLWVKESCPAFVQSDEYAVVSENDELPGVILAAFGRFVSRLARDEGRTEMLERAVRAVDLLYGWRDYQVRDAIRDEFVESFDGELAAVEVIRPFLGGALSDAFDTLTGERRGDAEGRRR